MKFGYVRVSTLDQNEERQLDGVTVDRAFTDKVSGKSADRPQLQLLLAVAQKGDIIIVHSLDRLARNLEDLLRIVRDLNSRGVTIEFAKENLRFTPEVENPISTLIMSVLGAIAQFERALIRERQREGIAMAKKRGIYKGRKPVDPSKVAVLRKRVGDGESVASVCRDLMLSRSAAYEYLRQADDASAPEKSG